MIRNNYNIKHLKSFKPYREKTQEALLYLARALQETGRFRSLVGLRFFEDQALVVAYWENGDTSAIDVFPYGDDGCDGIEGASIIKKVVRFLYDTEE